MACAAPTDRPARSASGCRCRAGTWRWSTRGRAGRPGRDRRAGDRRRRPGPLPRPGEGRREVRADAHARLGARLPQRRPGPARPDGLLLPGPRRRPGEGRRAAHRARRDRRGAGAPARRVAARRPRSDDRQRHAAAGRLHRQRRPGLRPSTPRAPRSRERCPPRWCRGWSWSTNCRPAPRARSTATRCRGRSVPRRRRRRDLGGTMGWLAGLWRDVLGAQSTARRRTSSPSAAVRCRRPSWWPRCAHATPADRRRSSTTIRGWARWPGSSTNSPRRSRPSRGSSRRPRCARRPPRCAVGAAGAR